MTIQAITGEKEIDRKLERLEKKSARKVARRAVNKSTRTVTNAIKQEAPKGRRHRDALGRFATERKSTVNTLSKAIGQRALKKSEAAGQVAAKTGVGVGKRKKKEGKRAPHAHLVALGTRRRKRRKVGGVFKGASRKSTGRMPANDFVKRGYSKSKAIAFSELRKLVAEGIEKEANK